MSPAEKCPFRTLIEEWLDYGRADDLASKTIADYRDKVYKFWWWWHDHTQYALKLGAHPKNVMVKEAREYAVYLREPQEMRWGIEAKVKKPKLAAASVSSYGRAVKVFFNWLEAENYIETNPFGKKVKFTNRHKQDQTIKRVQESDLTLLFTFLTAPARVATYMGCRDLAIICFLLDSGIRLGELLSLTLADIDLEHNRCRVEGKTGVRQAVFSEGCRAALCNYLQHARHPLPIKDPNTPADSRVWLTVDGQPLSFYGCRVYRPPDTAR